MTKDELSEKISSFIIAEIEKKYKGQLIQKMFFEMCPYYNKGENGEWEDWIEFRAIVTSKAEVERVIEKYVKSGESREDAISISESSGEYDTEDWKNHVRFNFQEKEYGIEYWEWSDKIDACKGAVKKIMAHKFTSFTKTSDFKADDELWIND
ncbi:hypothetical protein [Treponema saccharophilum]|uniref:Uncharacterized protein n=1 Tax=Treponema saccharophilum DSM 2985 TaxID=907348 RepID=H7EL48_9SPIR|nr:hypothetical protein [Treponema saccharophilum]EIC01773.1 hypothetical protein TresaDRAFT_1062 [Treponema saccharophilum DSM 2985]BDC97152.1 hypothetical protein TRSA_22510 [Treponema saccharophilum]